MDLLSQSSLLVGVTSFGLGASVLARNVRNKLFLTFAALAMVVAAWALTFFLEKIWGEGGFYRWHLFFNVWIGPFGLALIRVLTRLRDGFSRTLRDLTIFSAAGLSVGLLFHYEATPWVLQAIYFLPVVLVIQILQLILIGRRPAVGSRGRGLVYLGALLVLATSAMDHVPFLGDVVPVIGNLALTVYLFFLSQLVTQQRLLNFGALFSRFLVLLAIALMLTAIYSMLFAWIQNSPALFFLNSFIVSFLLLTLIEPIRSMVSYLTQRLLTQKHLRMQESLRDAQRRLASVLETGALFQEILTTVEQSLAPNAAALFVLRSDGTKFKRVTGLRPRDGEILYELIANHPLLEYCHKLRRKGYLPVLLDEQIENEIDRSASRAQREKFAGLIEGLKALDANLLIPLFDSETILGFVAVNVPDPPEPWGNNWGFLRIIYPYFEQAAQTMRNMEIYVQQREKERLAALGEMAAGLAHEIRNPLGAIKGAAQFLDPTADRPESRFLSVIIEETDRLNRVVTQFLDYSKPASTDLSSVDLAILARRTVELVRPSLPASVRLNLELRTSSAKVMGSAEQIHQVVLNFIQNSVRSIERSSRRNGDGLIVVVLDAESGQAVLSVEDNGTGVKKEHLDKLFIPFFTTSPSGTGLGLSISHKIVEAHRGRIDVSSEEGRFARFSMLLPLHQDLAETGRARQ